MRYEGEYIVDCVKNDIYRKEEKKIEINKKEEKKIEINKKSEIPIPISFKDLCTFYLGINYKSEYPKIKKYYYVYLKKEKIETSSGRRVKCWALMSSVLLDDFINSIYKHLRKAEKKKNIEEFCSKYEIHLKKEEPEKKKRKVNINEIKNIEDLYKIWRRFTLHGEPVDLFEMFSKRSKKRIKEMLEKYSDNPSLVMRGGDDRDGVQIGNKKVVSIKFINPPASIKFLGDIK